MKIALIHATWPEWGRSWSAMPAAFRGFDAAGKLQAGGLEIEDTELWGEPSLKGAFVLAGLVREAVGKARAEKALPVVICGSCTIAALGAIAALGPESGILWLDAHSDLNTPETTQSGLFDGMALAIATGLCWRGLARAHAGLQPASLKNTVFFGVRDVDPPEADLIDANAVPTADSANAIAARLSGRPSVYIHLDMDVHDSLELRTNIFAVPGGPSAEDVRGVLGDLGGRLPVGALSLTGLEPDAPDAERGVAVALEHVSALAGALSTRLGPI